MPAYLPKGTRQGARVMIFVDGENLAIRYGAILDDRVPPHHVIYERNVFAWSHYDYIAPRYVELIRTYYYTCVGEDELKRRSVEEHLKGAGVHAPRVFSKAKGKRSKRVDITLATDMLTHAHRDNYDIAVLVAGDQDYVPLVDAVTAEGKRVAVWFFPDATNPSLRQTADHFFDIGQILLEYKNEELTYLHM
jgi:uncharacterized LabA/DUF88 family protein